MSSFLHITSKSNLRTHGDPPKSTQQMSSAIIRRKNTAGVITITDLKLYYQDVVMKAVLDRHKNR